MKYLVLLPMLLITAVLWSQPMDGKRMKRDIEVAENILATLLEESTPNRFQAYQVEGTYLESYGLLFTIQNRFGVFGLRGSAPAVIWDGERGLRGKVETKEDKPIVKGYAITLDSAGLNMQDIRGVSEAFLADYGYLLTQVPDDQRICIKYTRGSGGRLTGLSGLTFSSGADSGLKTPGFTMVIPKRAVEDLRAGKIERKAFLSRIEYTEHKGDQAGTDRELILLNSIFNRLYQRDLSEGFYMRGNGSVEKIPGLGALFSYRFSTPGDGDRFFFRQGDYRYYFDFSDELRAIGEARSKERREREDEDEHDYEEPEIEAFLEDFKSNIIEYGSTVRNLAAEEVLSFELQFPSCEDCDDRPEKVKITAKKSLLEQYRNGSLDLDEAVGQLQVVYE